jgi:hypothetical protein
MLPSFILDEVARRLASDKLGTAKKNAVCRAVGIDLDVALACQPGDNRSVELLPYTSKFDEGVLWFDLRISDHQGSRVVPGRVIYATSAPDEHDEIMQMTKVEVLDWNEFDPAPCWTPFSDNLLPPGFYEKLTEQIRERVRHAATERG